MQETKYNVDDKRYWENLYKNKHTPWQLNSYAPPLKTFLDSPYSLPPGKIAVLGCGRGHDCMLFAQYGFEVTGIDFSSTAINSCLEKFNQAGISGTRGFLLEKDIFDCHEYDNYFDYVLEHTCFCSVHPSRRRQYAYTVNDLLKPSGKFIALFWTLERKGSGPPFALDRTELFDYFKDLFNFDIVHQPTDSVPDRQGKELFMLMTPKKGQKP